MSKMRFVLSEFPDPKLEEAAIIRRLMAFQTCLQNKRLFSAQMSKSAENNIRSDWTLTNNDIPKALEIRIRRWAKKIHRNHMKRVGLTHLSPDDLQMLRPCRDGADIFELRDLHHADEIAAALHAEYPWLSDATTYVWQSLRQNCRNGRPGAHFAPVLLDGPPGIGKSAWARSLAQLLGAPEMIIDATVENASFSLVGSQRGWSNSMPGRLLSFMLRSSVANPLVVIDEIEKSGVPTSAKGRTFSLPDALLPLLEGMTARSWTCPYFQCGFDMSSINWVLTSNNHRDLPEPLLSRLHVIKLKTLSRDHLRQFITREAVKRKLSSESTENVATTIDQACRDGYQIDLRTVIRALELAENQQSRSTLH